MLAHNCHRSAQHKPFVPPWAAKVGRHPSIGQRLDQIRRPGDIAATDRGSKQIRKAADADQPLRRVENCKARGWRSLPRGEESRLQRWSDRGCPPRPDADPRPAPDCPAPRQSRRWDCATLNWPYRAAALGLQRMREHRQLGTHQDHGSADDAQFIDLQQSLKIEVTGIIEQHRIARRSRYRQIRSWACDGDPVSRIAFGPIGRPASANYCANKRRKSGSPPLIAQSVRTAASSVVDLRNARRSAATGISPDGNQPHPGHNTFCGASCVWRDIRNGSTSGCRVTPDRASQRGGGT